MCIYYHQIAFFGAFCYANREDMIYSCVLEFKMRYPERNDQSTYCVSQVCSLSSGLKRNVKSRHKKALHGRVCCRRPRRRKRSQLVWSMITTQLLTPPSNFSKSSILSPSDSLLWYHEASINSCFKLQIEWQSDGWLASPKSIWRERWKVLFFHSLWRYVPLADQNPMFGKCSLRWTNKWRGCGELKAVKFSSLPITKLTHGRQWTSWPMASYPTLASREVMHVILRHGRGGDELSSDKSRHLH